MVGWHHRLDGHEFESTQGVGDGQGSLACCSPWGRKESDTIKWLSWTEYKWNKILKYYFLLLSPYSVSLICDWKDIKIVNHCMEEKKENPVMWNILKWEKGSEKSGKRLQPFCPFLHFSHALSKSSPQDTVNKVVVWECMFLLEWNGKERCQKKAEWTPLYAWSRTRPTAANTCPEALAWGGAGCCW